MVVHETVLQVSMAAAWFFLPGFAANAAPPVLAGHPLVKKVNAPIDGGRTWRGQPVLGTHKTWAGFIGGVLAAVAATYIAQHYWSHPLSLFESGVLGAGVLFGDMVKSFAKRRIGVAAGKPWIPFDQIDYVFGGFAAAAALGVFNYDYFLALLVIAPAASILANHFMYWAGFQDEAW